MIIIPAIDLLDGKCVRLYQGDYSKSTTYPRDPVETARSFVAAGARRIHIVDLNAARGDGTHNRKIIGLIREAVSVTLEVGGGLRREEDIHELAGMGIDRLIVGTTLVDDPESVRRWSEIYPERIIAGIDAKNGKVRISGWERQSQLSDTDAAIAAAKAQAAEIIYTNIDKDGTLEGPDIERSAIMARTSGLPVIVSGGVRGREDFAAAAERESEGIIGIIAGKALYDGAFDLSSAIKEFL
ncbi:MAG: 1-(5-phosphoribosyl)-5-[(5-phosphoribosylamino)methylideneamino]imidazole-4-carboxamide isomerase [Spirochaetia bacterium]